MIPCSLDLAHRIAEAEAPIVRRFTPHHLVRVECAMSGSGIVRWQLRLSGGGVVSLGVRYVSKSYGLRMYEDLSGDLRYRGRIIRVGPIEDKT